EGNGTANVVAERASLQTRFGEAQRGTCAPAGRAGPFAGANCTDGKDGFARATSRRSRTRAEQSSGLYLQQYRFAEGIHPAIERLPGRFRQRDTAGTVDGADSGNQKAFRL